MKNNFLLLTLLIIIIDQLTKISLKNISGGIITYTTNTGAAFSLFQNSTNILILISGIVAISVVYFYKKYPKSYIPLAFILGGTIGNLIDRIYFGYVRDFIDLKIWPIFNVADSFNVIGVTILIYLILKEKI
ncbi:signal peptidase II [archaeon]|mgnify:CR=1 FL=1|jgi:signal peptidase II|nr:signal peptidase II [archaeon]MBT6824361.1 signal peptidase II [archaeon]MBT7106911.1 signal peptidase II [archaeon]MBT7297464.1 signal peptidase II [archaeon]